VQYPVLDFCDRYVIQATVRRPNELNLHIGRSRTSDTQPPCGSRSELGKIGGFGVHLNIPSAIEVRISSPTVRRKSDYGRQRT
jgi:hypothetical protein